MDVDVGGESESSFDSSDSGNDSSSDEGEEGEEGSPSGEGSFEEKKSSVRMREVV